MKFENLNEKSKKNEIKKDSFKTIDKEKILDINIEDGKIVVIKGNEQEEYTPEGA